MNKLLIIMIVTFLSSASLNGMKKNKPANGQTPQSRKLSYQKDRSKDQLQKRMASLEHDIKNMSNKQKNTHFNNLIPDIVKSPHHVLGKVIVTQIETHKINVTAENATALLNYLEICRDGFHGKKSE